MEPMRELWAGLPESTRRGLKTLWQAFLGTFLAVLGAGLATATDAAALRALLLAAIGSAIAAVAAKLQNLGKDEPEGGESDG